MNIVYLLLVLFLVFSYFIHKHFDNEKDFLEFEPQRVIDLEKPKKIPKKKTVKDSKNEDEPGLSNEITENELKYLSKLLNSEKYEEIIDRISETSRINLPEDQLSKFFYIAGLCYFKNYNTKMGIKYTGLCIDEDSESDFSKTFKGLCYQTRSEIYYLLREFDRAIHDAEMSIQFNPMNMNEYRGKSLYLKGISEVKLKQFRAGLRDLEASMSLFPKIIKESYYKTSVSEANARLEE